ncbi:hypothetical protein GKQ23_15665 [Erwinia sp. E602]|uniref:hypothetical protein n=1 Tax=Erwinia sp. E602 TaxID=2675378 RepID=UPI001BA94106|nr:hypothetical protein [Erwinia sp. E602]QUG76351.1 hypothetical protein GKQ23_15665 [Erwinia sp. E602]
MENILIFASSLSVLAFWIGLIKPTWVGMPNRKRSSLIYFSLSIVLAVVTNYLFPTKKSAEEVAAAAERSAQSAREAKAFKHSTVTLSKYQSKPQAERRDIVSSFLISEDIPESTLSKFYNCLSEYSATKSDGLQIGLVLDWCKKEYVKDPSSLDARMNFDNFFDNFSRWDGSYTPLVTVIKSGMNDEDSYKHVKTSYRLIMNDKPHAFVTTIFSGTNAFGGRVKNTIIADVDIKTGRIIDILGDN